MFELSPQLIQRFFTADGTAPLAGGLLYTYAAGTTTPLATYTDSTGQTPNTNPVVLDSTGSAPVWLGPNTYKFLLTDSKGNEQFSVDNVESIQQIIAALGIQQFNPVNISYTQAQTASTSIVIPLFTLNAASLLGRLIIKHSQSFTGGSISAVTASIGTTGSPSEYLEPFDIFQAPGDQVYDLELINDIPSFENQTVVNLTITATGANLSSLTQGALKVSFESVNSQMGT